MQGVFDHGLTEKTQVSHLTHIAVFAFARFNMQGPNVPFEPEIIYRKNLMEEETGKGC